MDTGEFAARLLDEFDIVVANWHKRKKGFNHHDGKRLMREAMINVLLGKTRQKLRRPPSEDQELEDE